MKNTMTMKEMIVQFEQAAHAEQCIRVLLKYGLNEAADRVAEHYEKELGYDFVKKYMQAKAVMEEETKP